MSSYTREKEVALEAVTAAAELCTTVQAELVKVATLDKDDRSPVTVADFGSQALVCERLRRAFPDDPIVGEEDAGRLRQPENSALLEQVAGFVRRQKEEATPEMICNWIDAGNGQVAERFWTLDPIDGTKGFLRNDQYAIALALIEQGEVKVAAVACPTLRVNIDDPLSETGLLFVAVRGQGAARTAMGRDEFVSIEVNQARDPRRRRFVESVEAGHANHVLQQAIAQAVGITQPPLRMDSQAKYGAVARGDATLYLRLPSPKSPDYREKIRDHAAGSLLVEEAGGQVTDMHGQPLDLASDYKMNNNRGVIVSNGQGHEAVIEAIKTHGTG